MGKLTATIARLTCVLGLALCACTAHGQNTFPANGNVGIGTADPALGALQISAPDQSTESAIAIRQSNSTGYGFDFALDQKVNGMGYILGIAGGNRTTLMQLDRINNFVGIGMTPPQAKFQVSDTARTYDSINNEYDSSIEVQGVYSGKAIGQGPSLGFIAPANTDGTNPWEMARILVSPDSVNGSDARGRMYLQTRTNNGSGWAWNNNLVLNSVGSVGIGTIAPGYTLDVAGTIHASGGVVFPDGSVQTQAFSSTLCGGDYAESVETSGDRLTFEPGDVLVLDKEHQGAVLKSSEAYSTVVAGIYSTKPGAVGRRQTGPKSSSEIPISMVGIVPTKVTAENGPIEIGDLLVTSSRTGYAMRGTDRSRMLGAVVGKAMGPLASGTGVVDVLVTLQ